MTLSGAFLIFTHRNEAYNHSLADACYRVVTTEVSVGGDTKKTKMVANNRVRDTQSFSLPAPNPPTPDTTVYNQIAQLTPNLFLSSATALTPQVLSKYNVSLIINVTKELPLLPVEGAKTLRISIEDRSSEDLFPYFESVSSLVREHERSGGLVVIHCVAGVSRSAVLCLAFLVKYYCSLSEAWSYVKTIRPWVNPNTGFWTQLESWEQLVKKERERGRG